MTFQARSTKGRRDFARLRCAVQEKTHHPVFSGYDRWSGLVDAGFHVNFLGVRVRCKFVNMEYNGVRMVQTEYPAFDNKYFEWIDLLESVEEAEGGFTMVELGAGYGKWLVRAALALRQRKPTISPYLIGVEAEPTHFKWAKIHFRDNDLDPDEHLLVKAAVAAEDGSALFLTGHSREWYGQSLVPPDWAAPPLRLRRKLEAFLRFHSRNDEPLWKSAQIARVKTISLRSLLQPLRYVNFIYADVQGAEYDVIKAASEEVDEKVKRIHIQTHDEKTAGAMGKNVEKGLREVFNSMGWAIIRDYPAKSKAQTPYGDISFDDGIQTWVNSKLR